MNNVSHKRLLFFSKTEYDTVDALFEVIIPSDEDPGSREARSVDFLDNLLSNPSMYWQIDIWKKKWRIGLKIIEEISINTYNMSFSRLTLLDRTDIVTKLSEGKLTSWKTNKESELDQKDFFKIILLHAIQGFLSDPRYFGNTDKMGWKCIGFKG